MTDATGRQAAADLVTHFLKDPSRYGHVRLSGVLSMNAFEFMYVACFLVISGIETPMPQEPQSAVQQTADLIVCKLYTA